MVQAAVLSKMVIMLLLVPRADPEGGKGGPDPL